MFFLVLLIITTIVSIVSAFLVLRIFIKKKLPKILLVISIIAIIAGFITALTSFQDYSYYQSLQSWQSAEAIITSSEIINKKIVVPKIKYKYSVEMKDYSASTTMRAPGFGSKRKKLDAATTLVEEYPVASSLTIYYNPDNPAESVVKRHPPWNIYMRQSCGLFFYWLGIVFFIAVIFSKNKKEAEE